MKPASAVLLGVLLFAQPAAAAADQFDLVCKGTVTTKTASGTKVEDFSRHLRIDLSQGKYCDDDCRGLFDIVKVNPAAIVIDEGVLEAGTFTSVFITSIDRVTGRYSSLEHISEGQEAPSRKSIETNAICEPRPFSGFEIPGTRF